MKKYFTPFLLTFISFCTLQAQDGALDSTFAQTGILLLDLVGATETANGVVVQEDGKILIVASAQVTGGFDIEVVRLLENGTLDSTFADNGAYRFTNEVGSDLGYDIQLLDDGSILVCGGYHVEENNAELFVGKLDSTGQPDSTFGDNGLFIHPVDNGEDLARTLAVSENGDIYVGGSSGIPGFSGSRNILAKIEATGIIDTAFGNNGIFMWNTDTTFNEVLQLEITPDGHLLTSGRVKPAGSDRVALYKVLNDGSGFDLTFGSNGQVLAPLQGKGYGLAVKDNGEIYVTGNNLTSQGYDLIVAAYLPDGTPKSAFGLGGVTTVNYGINDVGLSLFLQPDGKIIAGGESGGTFFAGPPRAFFSVRLDTMGVVDTLWGAHGFVETPTSNFFAFSNASALQADGKVLLVGASATSTTGNDLTVIRYGNFIDVDQDGFGMGEDCNDFEAAINPDAEEIANNDIDENCDGITLIIDEDMDGFNSDEDCDDNDPDINPGAEEIANNDVDEDCDGVALIIDEDMDGFNSDEDCDDNNPDIYPGAEEIPNNGIDEDCDGGDLIVSTYESELAREFNLFPNPTHQLAYLDYQGNSARLERIVIADVSGRMLQNITVLANATRIELNLTNFSEGVYLVTIVTSEGTAVKRLIKQ